MDTTSLTDVNDGQMELVLESDEEEASLLEEMEQQETVPCAGTESECKTKPSFAGTRQKVNNKSLKVNNSLQTYVNEDNLSTVGNTQCRQSIQQSIFQRLCSGDPIKEMEPDSELEDKLGGAQILQLDISEYDLIAAKSAVALRPQMDTDVLSSSPFPPHFLSQGDVCSGSGSFSLAGQDTFHHNILGPPGTDTNGKKKRIQNTKKTSGMKNSGFNHFNIPVGEHTLPRRIQKKQKRNIPPDNIHKQEQVVQVRHAKQNTTNGIVKSVQGSPRGILTAESSKPPEVVFCCQFCNLKLPLKKENIPGIVTHLNPPQRYNHVFKMPDQLTCYKENIKLSVVTAKNKSKVQVQLVSRVECVFCKQQLTCSVENREHIILHMHWCQIRNFDDSKTVPCVFCNERINRSCIRKHLYQRSRRCKKVDALTLQLMSSVCEDYARQYKPICIVCNEREWPYKGHRCDMEPVCESCHLNITSGNTTKLAHRDVTVCAICGLHCADKYVTYWASEMESLFIGESCIKKLNNPKPKLSEETVSLKAAKLKLILETALSSLTVQEGSENDPSVPRLAPNIFDKYERKCGSSNLSQSQGYIKTYKANNSAQERKIIHIAKPFKIFNSHTNFVPSSAVIYSEEAEDKVNIENISLLSNVPHVSLDFQHQETQACTGSQASGVSFIPLSEQISHGDEECETQKTGLELQEKLHCVADGKSENFAQITYNSKGGEVRNTLQIASLDDGNSDCKMYTESTPESDRNILPTQSSVTETPVAEELHSHSAVPKVTTGSQQLKYVIKCVSTSGSKPAEGIPNIIDKNHIIIKASSKMPFADEMVKCPRLATIIKTRRIVCEEECDEKKPLMQKRHKRKQTFSNDQASEAVMLD